MNPQFEIRWTPIALESLETKSSFIENKWNDEVLGQFYDLMESKISLLRTNLRLAPPLSNTIFRRLYIHKIVSMFYSIERLDIFIELIWDNRQDPNKLEEKLLS